MTRRLVTGATGLVGGSITLELLRRTPDDVYCLVRAASAEEAGHRLRGALRTMASGYGCPELAAGIARRAHAIRGDLTWPGCTEPGSRLPRIDEVWHCAASLQYEDQDREEIELHNVQGTANVLALARQLQAGTFHYISTAYVGGCSQGLIQECPAPGPEFCNNAYEISKAAGERLVLDAAADMRVKIMRPGIVIGHSRTYFAVTHTGMYGFVRQLVRFNRQVSRRLGTFLVHSRVRLLAEPDIECNLIPVDLVARNAVTIGLSGSAATFYHLTNAAAPTVGAAAEVCFSQVGLRTPLWVSDRDEFTALDEILDGGMSFYQSYMRSGKTFDRSNTDAVCGAGASVCPLPGQELASYISHFLSQCHLAPGDGLRARVLHESVT